MSDSQLFALDFGTSTLQWSRIDIAKGSMPQLASQDSMPNVLQVRNGDLVAIGEDAAEATLAHLDTTFAEYKMHLNSDDSSTWERNIDPSSLTEKAIKWLVCDPSKGLPVMGYTPKNPLIVSVPGHWEENGRGRNALSKALENAGVETYHFIHEPYAALMWWLKTREGSLIELADGYFTLVYDFGGGTLDIALLAEGASEDEMLHGAHVIGGKDFDKRLADHFERQIRETAGKENLCMADRLAIHRAAKKTKEKLSQIPEGGATISKLESLPRGCDVDITREEFEEVCSDLLDRSAKAIQTTLARNSVGPKQVGRVLLTGGSSVLWSMRRRIQEVLPHLTEQDYVSSPAPQHDVARGGAVFGAIYYSSPSTAPGPVASKNLPTDTEIEDLVWKYAGTTALAVAINPIPLVDLMAGVGLNWKMISDVAKQYEREFGEEEAKALGTEILKCMAAMGFVYIVSSVLKIVLIGTVLQAGVAGYITFITGLASREYFKKGSSWGEAGAAAVVESLKIQHPPIETIKRIAGKIKNQTR